MPFRDWLRPPRSLLMLYLAGAAVAVACLVWLAARQLHQDAALDAQRTTERLQGTANLAVARSLQALVELDRARAGRWRHSDASRSSRGPMGILRR